MTKKNREQMSGEGGTGANNEINKFMMKQTYGWRGKTMPLMDVMGNVDQLNRTTDQTTAANSLEQYISAASDIVQTGVHDKAHGSS